MLLQHMNAVEGHLLEISKIPANSGHPLHKGTPRETFIREFLEKHLNSTVSLGSGEIIDCNSQPSESRNQYDIVIFKRNYPKLDFGGSISGFLSESVVATIEVKSTLDKAGIKQAIQAAYRAKQLSRNIIKSFHTGYIPPAIVSYVVAYDGPAKMETVHGWIKEVYLELGMIEPIFQVGQDRSAMPSPSLDGVYILGKGFCNFCNIPYSFLTSEILSQQPAIRWEIANCSRGSLLSFFLNLTVITNNVEAAWLDPLPYLTQFRVEAINFAY